jgi:hypothetical protein
LEFEDENALTDMRQSCFESCVVKVFHVPRAVEVLEKAIWRM